MNSWRNVWFLVDVQSYPLLSQTAVSVLSTLCGGGSSSIAALTINLLLTKYVLHPWTVCLLGIGHILKGDFFDQ